MGMWKYKRRNIELKACFQGEKIFFFFQNVGALLQRTKIIVKIHLEKVVDWNGRGKAVSVRWCLSERSAFLSAELSKSLKLRTSHACRPWSPEFASACVKQTNKQAETKQEKTKNKKTTDRQFSWFGSWTQKCKCKTCTTTSLFSSFVFCFLRQRECTKNWWWDFFACVYGILRGGLLTENVLLLNPVWIYPPPRLVFCRKSKRPLILKRSGKTCEDAFVATLLTLAPNNKRWCSWSESKIAKHSVFLHGDVFRLWMWPKCFFTGMSGFFWRPNNSVGDILAR